MLNLFFPEKLNDLTQKESGMQTLKSLWASKYKSVKYDQCTEIIFSRLAEVNSAGYYISWFIPPPRWMHLPLTLPSFFMNNLYNSNPCVL